MTTRYRKNLRHELPQRQMRTRMQRPLVLPIALVSIIFLLGLVYVSQINTVATSGLAMKHYEEQQATLQQNNQELSIRLENLRSLTTVERTSKDLELVSRAPVKYLPAVPSSVAVAR